VLNSLNSSISSGTLSIDGFRFILPRFSIFLHESDPTDVDVLLLDKKLLRVESFSILCKLINLPVRVFYESAISISWLFWGM